MPCVPMCRCGRTGPWRRCIRSSILTRCGARYGTRGRWPRWRSIWRWGIGLRGHKKVLGMLAANTDGAKFWLHVLTELKNRGVRDIFIGCVDGIKGFPEAMEVVFPVTQVQLCQIG